MCSECAEPVNNIENIVIEKKKCAAKDRRYRSEEPVKEGDVENKRTQRHLARLEQAVDSAVTGPNVKGDARIDAEATEKIVEGVAAKSAEDAEDIVMCCECAEPGNNNKIIVIVKEKRAVRNQTYQSKEPVKERDAKNKRTQRHLARSELVVDSAATGTTTVAKKDHTYYQS
jgi:hypothetical protein